MVDKAEMIEAERQKMSHDERMVRALESIEKQMFALKGELVSIRTTLAAQNTMGSSFRR